MNWPFASWWKRKNVPVLKDLSKIRLQLENLEDRAVPTASPLDGEFLVNTQIASSQYLQSVAMDADGDAVVAWAANNNNPDNSVYGVFVQRYFRDLADGGRLKPRGVETAVNTTTFSSQTNPAVAMDAVGNYVVAWQSFSQDSAGWGIYARSYNSVGVSTSNEFRVNTTVTNDQTAPAIAMTPTGGYVVTWTSVGLDGSSEIFAQRFTREGFTLGSEIPVNTTVAGEQTDSRVAIDAQGNFVVTWATDNQDGQGKAIFARRFKNDGTALSGEFQVNTFVAADQIFPDVAMDYQGNFTITWTSGSNQDGAANGVFFQRFSNTGARLGTEARANTFTTSDQQNSRIVMNSLGNFTIVWQSQGQDGNSWGIFGQNFNRDGAALGNEFRINTTTPSSQRLPAVGGSADGDYLVTWASFGQDGSAEGTYGQFFSEPVDVVGPTIPYVFQPNGIAVINDGTVVPVPLASATLVFSENMWTLGGTTGLHSVTNKANWSLTRNGIDFSSRIRDITFSLNAATNRYEAVVTFIENLGVGSYVLTAKGAIFDFNGNPLDGGNDGLPYGENFNRSFSIPNTAPIEIFVTTNINPPFPPPQASVFENSPEGTVIGTVITDDTDLPDRGRYRYDLLDDAGGRFALRRVTNASGLDEYSLIVLDGTLLNFEVSAGHTVVIRATDTQGATVVDAVTIPVLNVNEAPTITLPDTHPSLDSAGALTFSAANGNPIFVADPDAFSNTVSVTLNTAPGNILTLGSTSGVGNVIGDGTNIVSFEGTIANVIAAMDGLTITPQPGFTVIDAKIDVTVDDLFNSHDPTAPHIKNVVTQSLVVPRLLDSVFPELKLNTTIPGNQTTPSVAMTLNGNFIAVWAGQGSTTTLDKDQFGIYGRLFNRSGIPTTAEFLVNTTTTLSQTQPKVAINAHGDFVVVWTSRLQDGSGDGIYAQRFNTVGEKIGKEFRVNTIVAGDQNSPDVSMDADGDFIVTWTDRSSGVTFIKAQRFKIETEAASTEGAVRIGGEFTISAGPSQQSSVATDYEGAFVVSWTQQDPATGRWDVFTKLYNSGGALRFGPFKFNIQSSISPISNSVAMDYDGNYVLGFTSDFESRAYRFNKDGAFLASARAFNPTTTVEDVTMNLEGSYGVASTSNFQTNDFLESTFQPFNRNSGQAEMFLQTANNTLPGLQRASSVSMDAEGDYVVAWQSNYQEQISGVFQGYGVYARVYRVPVDHVGPSVTSIYRIGSDDRILPGQPLQDGLINKLVVVFSEDMNVSGGAAGANSVLNPANYILERRETSGAYTVQTGAVASVDFLFNTATGRFEATLNFAANLAGGHYRLKFDASKLQDVAGNNLLPRIALTGEVPAQTAYFHVVEFDINRTPTNIILSKNTIMEGSAVGAVVGKLTATDTDDNQTATFSLVSNPGNAFRIVGNVLQVRTPSALDFERDPLLTVRVRVTDSANGVFERDFFIKVLNGNDRPFNQNPTALNMFRNGTLVFNAVNGNQIRVFDPDGYVNPVQVTLTATFGTFRAASLVGVTATGNGTGNVTLRGTQWAVNNAMNGLRFTPPTGRTGTATITVTTNDLGSKLGAALTARTTFTVRVINRAPLAPLPNFTSAFTYNVASGGTLKVSTAFGVLRGKTDLDKDPLTVRLSTSATRGKVVLNANGSFTYSAPAGFTGLVLFKFRYHDGLVSGNEVTVRINVT